MQAFLRHPARGRCREATAPPRGEKTGQGGGAAGGKWIGASH